MSIESDLKVIGPNDRLIIVLKNSTKAEAWLLCKQMETYLSSEKCRVIAINNFDVYVIKEGANIQIRDEIGQMSKELKIALFGELGFDS